MFVLKNIELSSLHSKQKNQIHVPSLDKYSRFDVNTVKYTANKLLLLYGAQQSLPPQTPQALWFKTVEGKFSQSLVCFVFNNNGGGGAFPMNFAMNKR